MFRMDIFNLFRRVERPYCPHLAETVIFDIGNRIKVRASHSSLENQLPVLCYSWVVAVLRRLQTHGWYVVSS